MAVAEDDGGELIVGDVTRTGGRALAVGLSTGTDEQGRQLVSIDWVEQDARLELTVDEAVALRDEMTRIAWTWVSPTVMRWLSSHWNTASVPGGTGPSAGHWSSPSSSSEVLHRGQRASMSAPFSIRVRSALPSPDGGLPCGIKYTPRTGAPLPRDAAW
jgi:hypothetical protein